MELVLGWMIVGAVVGALIASAKGGSAVSGGLLGLLLGPLGWLITVLTSGPSRRCPHCRGGITEGVSTCRHCGKSLAGWFSLDDKPVASGMIKSSQAVPWLRQPDLGAPSGKFLSPRDKVEIMGRSGAFIYVLKGKRGGWAPAEAVEVTRGALPAALAAAPPSSDASGLDQLEKLAALNKQGVITDEEFAAKKRQLLGL